MWRFGFVIIIYMFARHFVMKLAFDLYFVIILMRPLVRIYTAAVGACMAGIYVRVVYRVGVRVFPYRGFMGRNSKIRRGARTLYKIYLKDAGTSSFPKPRARLRISDTFRRSPLEPLFFLSPL